MSLYLLHYYFMKDSINSITQSVIKDANIDNNEIFRKSFFYSSCDFYKMLNPFKIDQYRIKQQIKSDLAPLFIRECLKEAKESENNNHKLFTYALILSYHLEKSFNYYIDANTSKSKSKIYIEKMIDSYFFNKNEHLSLHKINIADYFFEGFVINDNDISFMEKPMKRVFGFFKHNEYYKACYQTASKYYDHLSRAKTPLKKLSFIIYDALFNHRKNKRKAKTYLYHKKIDTTILNLTKKDFNYKDSIINLNIDEFYNMILKEAKIIINALNEYYDLNILKSYNKIFNLEE